MKLPGFVLLIKVCCNENATPQSPNWIGEPGREKWPLPHLSKSVQCAPIATLAASADGESLFVFYDSLGGWLYYSARNKSLAKNQTCWLCCNSRSYCRNPCCKLKVKITISHLDQTSARVNEQTRYGSSWWNRNR